MVALATVIVIGGFKDGNEVDQEMQVRLQERVVAAELYQVRNEDELRSVDALVNRQVGQRATQGPTPEPQSTPMPVAADSAPSAYLQGTDAQSMVAEVTQEVMGYGDWDAALVLRIIARESNFHCDSVNTQEWFDGSHASGVMQILLPLHQHYFNGDPLDCKVNIAAGHQMWVEQGYQPWAPLP